MVVTDDVEDPHSLKVTPVRQDVIDIIALLSDETEGPLDQRVARALSVLRAML